MHQLYLFLNFIEMSVYIMYSFKSGFFNIIPVKFIHESYVAKQEDTMGSS